MLMKAGVFVVALAGLVPATATGQVLAGPEFRLNASTTTSVTFPMLSMTPAGDFVAVWSALGAYPDPSGAFARRFDAAGAAVGLEFLASTDPLGIEARNGGTEIAADRAGNFVVVWVNDGRDGSYRGVFGRRFDASGAPLGTDFQVNTYTTGSQGDFFPGSIDVARAPDGRFVVVWEGAQGFVSGRDVFAQRYASDGSPLGGEFRVNTYTTNAQYRPGVAIDDAGNFVVVWSSDRQDGSFAGVFGRRFAATGAPQGSEFQVNTYTTGYQSGSQYSGLGVARAPGGEFVVVWSDTARQNVFGQRYDAAGSRAGTEFQVSSNLFQFQLGGRVAADARGNFVVSWMGSNSYYGSLAGGQRFHADGTRRGAEFTVDLNNTVPPHRYPRVASDDVGNFLFAWGTVNPVTGRSARAQRFGGLMPVGLRVDTAGNGVWEPGETAVARPSWRNTNGAVVTFGGDLIALQGPAGPTYSIADGTADYGAVADGVTGECADCYGVSVTGPRPSVHWDATAVESITPDAQGQQKQWTLHVGNSFADVPATSPFYRFVETLLHHSITGGCTGTAYCPTSVATREQMAVFVLAAKEGTGYAPPACVPPNLFADVPETSPFCRWIEELANRGVVGGCGPGLYCPASPVTREQMAVFVLRTLEPSLLPPPCAPPNLFDDVPDGSPFCRWVEELAGRGVVAGCAANPPLYCPASPVTREQMAVFIGVTRCAERTSTPASASSATTWRTWATWRSRSPRPATPAIHGSSTWRRSAGPARRCGTPWTRSWPRAACRSSSGAITRWPWGRSPALRGSSGGSRRRSGSSGSTLTET
jgi:hypothetical protein